MTSLSVHDQLVANNCPHYQREIGSHGMRTLAEHCHVTQQTCRVTGQVIDHGTCYKIYRKSHVIQHDDHVTYHVSHRDDHTIYLVWYRAGHVIDHVTYHMSYTAGHVTDHVTVYSLARRNTLMTERGRIHKRALILQYCQNHLPLLSAYTEIIHKFYKQLYL